MKVAYCRVSSSGQNLDSQIDSVKNYGVDRIFQEKVSGTSTKGREQLKEMLNFVREGDEVVFTRVDRVAASCLRPQRHIESRAQHPRVEIGLQDHSCQRSL